MGGQAVVGSLILFSGGSFLETASNAVAAQELEFLWLLTQCLGLIAKEGAKASKLCNPSLAGR